MMRSSSKLWGVTSWLKSAIMRARNEKIARKMLWIMATIHTGGYT